MDPDEVVLETWQARVERNAIHFYRPSRIVFSWPESLGVFIVILVLVARFIPLAAMLPSWGCGFRKFTGGWPCVSCGMTRSFDWFCQGRFGDSLAINPLGFLLAVSGCLAFIYALLCPLRPPRAVVTLTEKTKLVARISLASMALANWAYLLIRHATGVF